MDYSLLMTDITNIIPNDPLSIPFSLSSLDPLATPPLPPGAALFDSFAPPRWPWSYAKLPSPPSPPAASPPSLVLTTAQFDALKDSLLTSPLPRPSSASPVTLSFFEPEMEMGEYEKCYDEWMEVKLTVLREVKNRAQKKAEEEAALKSFPRIPTPTPMWTPEPEAVRCISPQDLCRPILGFDHSPSPSSSSSSSSSLPRTPEADLWEEGLSRPYIVEHSSPTPFNRTTWHATSCRPPESKKRTVSWFEEAFAPGCLDEHDDDDDDDDEYSPVREQAQNPLRLCKGVQRKKRPPPIVTQIRVEEDSTSEVAFRTPKRQKVTSSRCPPLPKRAHSSHHSAVADPEVICRINGCRHIAKTRFECYKHRETHFPGRFRCPHAACEKVFVRSSSLSRHLKRPQNRECCKVAGGPEEWGTGLVKFAMCEPPWMEEGFLDVI